MKNTKVDNIADGTPIIAIRDIVTFPNTVVPLFIGRPQSFEAANTAFENSKQVIIAAQIRPDIEDIFPENIHKFGTLANIIHIARTGKNEMKIIVDIVKRIEILKMTSGDILTGTYRILETESYDNKSPQIVALRHQIHKIFQECSPINGIQIEVISSIEQIENNETYTDLISSMAPANITSKQKILEETNLEKRMKAILNIYASEMKVLHLENKIQSKVREKLTKMQKEHYIREQISTMQSELRSISGGDEDEADSYIKNINKAKMPEEAHKKAMEEVEKLKGLSNHSSETSIVKGYLDLMIAMPWNKFSHKKITFEKAKDFLENNHYGLEKVKERILEYIAVFSRVQRPRGQILCLYGPPGVGKTSIVSSIAGAMGLKYAKIALGGMHDESEIRGHRKTYLGAFPGRIITALKRAEVMNPVILLDEIDKLGSSHRGDPASALLEVLDPEQNKFFQDNYLEVGFDLSNVTFIATANSLDIHPALLDRMEIIKVSGYTEFEKMHIAEKHIIPNVLKENGLKKGEVLFNDDAILEIIRSYTSESGVRTLKQEITKAARKSLVEIETSDQKKIKIIQTNVKKYLGIQKHDFGHLEESDSIGIVTGLAYTSAGGDILLIEATKVPGKGEIKATGKLGDVMKESASAALSCVLAHAKEFGVDVKDIQKHTIHIHVPDGATPKDGPSAGITIATAIVSLFTNRSVRRDCAMTGEITLRGKILPIGGLKEKLMSAVRSGVKTVFIPKENERDVEEIPEEITQELIIIPVSYAKDVFEKIFTK